MIETQRTSLRPISEEDRDSVFNYRNDSKTNKYQNWIPNTVQEVEKFISKNPSKFNVTNSWFQLVILEKQSNCVIGDVGIHFIDDHQVELGCTLSKDKQGNGIATEALKGIVDFLFKELDKHRVLASLDPRNHQSIKLMERLKFRKEAHFIKSILVHGKWEDDVIYAILKNEWIKN
jgi:RimJ/RimL family protein N-acetyltransferase